MVIMTQDKCFITIKIPESVHKNLTQYRDDNRLKSIGIAVQDGLDCLNLHKEIEYGCEIIQEIYRWSKLYAKVWIKYLDSVNQDEVTIELNEYISEIYKEIEMTIEHPNYNNIKNRYTLYSGLVDEFENISDIVKNSDCSQEVKYKIYEMYLNLLISVYNLLSSRQSVIPCSS